MPRGVQKNLIGFRRFINEFSDHSHAVFSDRKAMATLLDKDGDQVIRMVSKRLGLLSQQLIKDDQLILCQGRRTTTEYKLFRALYVALNRSGITC